MNLDDPDFGTEAGVISISGQRVLALSGIGGFEPGFFARGRLRFLSGANAGRVGAIKFHRAGTVELWQPVPGTVPAGERVRVTAGCDKQFATCRNRFANGINFRGFPHMPGDDAVMRYATREEK